NSCDLQYDLAGVSRPDGRERVVDLSEWEFVSDDRPWIELSAAEKTTHLVPRLIHLAPDHAVHGDALEDDLVGEIERDVVLGNTEQLHPAAHAHRGERLVQRRGGAGHLAHDI